MFLLLIISVQYYFLARFYHKNKLKTILSVIGLYFLANFIFAIIFAILIASKVVHVDFDFSNPDPVALNEYLNSKNIPIILEIVLFLALGVFYYNYLKRKWLKEKISGSNETNAESFESIKVMIEEAKAKSVFKTNFYCHFHQVNEKNVHWIPELANEIWNDTYTEIISKEQIEYMLNKMYEEKTILENIENGEHWEILKADNVPVGYIHYKAEENKVFLSKIYLKQDEKYKGLGQLMLNHIIKFALQENKTSIYLTVNKENKKAIRFYKKNGFKNIREEKFDIGEGYIMDDFIFEKELNVIKLGPK